MTWHGEIALGILTAIHYVGAMEANSTTTSRAESSLFPERRDMSLKLHSKFTVLRRTIHIICLVVAFYAFGYAVIQFKALSALTTVQPSPLGVSLTRVDSASQLAQLFARQWSSPAFSDPLEQDTVIDQFFGLEAVVYVAVFEHSGKLINQRPAGQTIRSILQEHNNAVTATAPFSGESQRGVAIIVIDDSAFKKLHTEKLFHLSKAILASLVLGVIAGIYLFRSVRQLIAKAFK